MGSRPAPPRPAPKPASRAGPQAPRSGRSWPPRQVRRGRTPASRAVATRSAAPSRAGRYAHRPQAGATRLGPCGWPRKATAKAAADGRPPRRRAEAIVHRPRGWPPHRRAEAGLRRGRPPCGSGHAGPRRRASHGRGGGRRRTRPRGRGVGTPRVSLGWAGAVDAEGGRRLRRRSRGATREREERWSCAAEEGTMALV